MIPSFRILFVGPPCRTSIDNQKFLLANTLPLEGHFEATVTKALTYLQSCSIKSFPTVVLIDEQIGAIAIDELLNHYRKQFYVTHMDTLIFIGRIFNSSMMKYENALIDGYINPVLDKALFLKKIYPLISVTMV